jgi:hypothetical protein
MCTGLVLAAMVALAIDSQATAATVTNGQFAKNVPFTTVTNPVLLTVNQGETFVGISVTVSYGTGFGKRYVVVTVPAYTAPTPGNNTTVSTTFPATVGTTYTIITTMTFTDAQGVTNTVTDTDMYTP